MTDTLVARFAETAARAGDRIALVHGTNRVTFAALEARSAAFAARLRQRGIGPGDRALVAMGVCPDLFAVLAALWRCGAAAVFPEPALGLPGLRHAARTTRPRALVATGWYRLLGLLPELWGVPTLVPAFDGAERAAPEPLSPEAPALISFTSGSTGRPKAILRGHAFLLAQHAAVAPILAGEAEEVDFVGFPVFALVNLAEGRTSVLPPWRMRNQHRLSPPALVAALAAGGATRALLPPALCARLAEATGPAGLATVFTGGGPVTPELVARLERAHPGLRVVSVYGSTEAEPIAALDWSQATPEARVALAAGPGLPAGQPVPEVRLRIVDDEIQVAGPHVNEGYLDPAQDAGTKLREDGRIWHRTGDAGRLDAAGQLWLLGRHGGVARGKDGARLYPFVVEQAARQDPQVREAAFWAQDGRTGVAVVAPGLTAQGARALAGRLGVDVVTQVDAIPMDRRHHSKVDQGALARLVRSAPNAPA